MINSLILLAAISGNNDIFIETPNVRIQINNDLMASHQSVELDTVAPRPITKQEPITTQVMANGVKVEVIGNQGYSSGSCSSGSCSSGSCSSGSRVFVRSTPRKTVVRTRPRLFWRWRR